MPTVLVVMLDDLLREADWGSETLFVFRDLSAVFDIVNHWILLDCLTRLEIGELALA